MLGPWGANDARPCSRWCTEPVRSQSEATWHQIIAILSKCSVRTGMPPWQITILSLLWTIYRNLVDDAWKVPKVHTQCSLITRCDFLHSAVSLYIHALIVREWLFTDLADYVFQQGLSSHLRAVDAIWMRSELSLVFFSCCLAIEKSEGAKELTNI